VIRTIHEQHLSYRRIRAMAERAKTLERREELLKLARLNLLLAQV